MEKVNSRISRFIKEKKIKQKELSEALGVARQTVSNLINDRYNPSLDFLQKLALSFPKLNTRWILLGEGDMIHEGSVVVQELGEMRIKLMACEDLCGILKKQIDDKEEIIALLKSSSNSSRNAS